MVKVQLDNTGKVETLKLDRTSVPAGKVRFEVTNASMDDTHEMIVVKTASDAGQVPDQQGRQQSRRKVVQGRQGSQRHQEWRQGTLDMNLTAGHDVLFCNIKNHFKNGMYAELTVTP